MSEISFTGIGVLDAVVLELTKGAEECVFEKAAKSEIADDADYNHPQRGHMVYRQVFKVSNSFVLGFGIPCSSYLSERYRGDILLLDSLDLPFEEDSLRKRITASSYFKSSLFIALADGQLSISGKSTYKAQMEPILNGTADFIESRATHNQELLSLSTLSPMVTSCQHYTPDLVPYMVGALQAILG